MRRSTDSSPGAAAGAYRMYLDDIQRRAEHTLTDAEERMLAGASIMASAPATTYGIFSDADFPYPTVTLSDGKSVKLDNAGFNVYRARAESRGSAEGDGGVLRRSRQVSRHVRDDAERADPDRHLLRADAPVSDRARSRARRPEHSDRVYMRLVEGVNRHLPTFHRYLGLRTADDGLDGAALLRSLRAARRLGRSQLPDRRGAGARPRGAGAARRGVHRRRASARSTNDGSTGYPIEGKRAGRLLERRRLRRAPLHAAELQRQVHRREHAGARARPHDAQLLLEQDAAVSDRVVSDLRRRSGVDFQRGAADRAHARRRSPIRRAKLSLLGNYLEGIKVDGVPPDAVRRVRAEDARDRREGPAAHRRGTRRALRRDHAEVLRPRQGRRRRSTITSRTNGHSSRTSTATSTSSSTRPRSPRRRRCRRKSWPATRRRPSGT